MHTEHYKKLAIIPNHSKKRKGNDYSMKYFLKA